MSPRSGLVALVLAGPARGAAPEQCAPGLLHAAADAAAAGVEVLFATGRPRPCMPAQLVQLQPSWLHTLIQRYQSVPGTHACASVGATSRNFAPRRMQSSSS